MVILFPNLHQPWMGAESSKLDFRACFQVHHSSEVQEPDAGGSSTRAQILGERVEIEGVMQHENGDTHFGWSERHGNGEGHFETRQLRH